MFTGVIGALLILAAWLVETRKLIKSRVIKDIDIKFLFIYLAGSVLLTSYAVERSDWVFIFLSAIISFLTIIEIVFVFIKKH